MGFVLFVHIIACIFLVIAILMQAGRGGGLTETFQSAENMFGTQTNKFMVRVTTVLAIIFISTSLIFAYQSSRSTPSLMTNEKLLSHVPKPKPKEQEPTVNIKVEPPQPMNATK